MTELRRNDQQQRYEILNGSEVLGYAEYRPAGDATELPHTEVSGGHEGEGLGSQLAQYALDDLRSRGQQVIPSCPFIAHYIEQHPEYADLVQG